MTTGRFDPYEMSPDDCVELVGLMNEIVMRRLMHAAETGDAVDIDRVAVVHEMTDSSGLEFDDILRYCEIGEFIMLDRETRCMDDEEADRWKMKREAVMALIDSLIEQAVENGVIDESAVPKDATLEMLEQMWKNS